MNAPVHLTLDVRESSIGWSGCDLSFYFYDERGVSYVSSFQSSLLVSVYYTIE